MELSLLEIWASMGILSKGVAISLVVMGIASAFVAIERFMVLLRAHNISVAFADKARPLMEAGEVEALYDLTRGKEFARGPLPRLLRLGLESYRANEDDRAVGPVEMAKRELHRKLEMMGTEARRGMGILASTGSTAPFIGLFGTVIGIITAFQGIAAAGGGGIGAVSAGIAEALIVTAVGLVVAIMAVLVFNFLNNKFDEFDQTMQHAAGELADYLEMAHGNSNRARS